MTNATFFEETYENGAKTAFINEKFGRHGPSGYVVMMRVVGGQTRHHFTDSIDEAREVAFSHCHDAA